MTSLYARKKRFGYDCPHPKVKKSSARQFGGILLSWFTSCEKGSNGKAEEVAVELFSEPTQTFRKGVAGEWKTHFKEAHKRVFKEIAGQLLIDLGYEKDFNW